MRGIGVVRIWALIGWLAFGALDAAEESSIEDAAAKPADKWATPVELRDKKLIECGHGNRWRGVTPQWMAQSAYWERWRPAGLFSFRQRTSSDFVIASSRRRRTALNSGSLTND